MISHKTNLGESGLVRYQRRIQRNIDTVDAVSALKLWLPKTRKKTSLLKLKMTGGTFNAFLKCFFQQCRSITFKLHSNILTIQCSPQDGGWGWGGLHLTLKPVILESGIQKKKKKVLDMLLVKAL